MKINIANIMHQIEIAHQALTTARDEMLRATVDAAVLGTGPSAVDAILGRIQERLDDAIAISQTCVAYGAIVAERDPRQQVQQALDTYEGAGYDWREYDSCAKEYFDAQSSYEYMGAISEYLGNRDQSDVFPTKPTPSEVDDDLFTFDDIDDPYAGMELYDDEESDDDTLDFLITHLNNDRFGPVTLGDERAAVAFDTTDMEWATLPLHEEAYRQLFGLPLTPNGDWHYDIFGNWHPGRTPLCPTDDPDYNIPF